MDKEIEMTLRSLGRRHLDGKFAEDSGDAKRIVLRLIPKDAVVGVGDSTTVAQLGLKRELKRMRTKILDGFDNTRVYSSIEDWDKFHMMPITESTTCDVFLTGTNAVTVDGRLVNVDGAGNRVAGMFWGHPNAIIVVGRNKIVKNLDEAFHRLRHVIAPNHIRIRAVELGGRAVKTPCVITGECTDCRARDRMCNIFTVIEGKPAQTEIHVVIVNEDLGLGWDESWPQKRILRIVEKYKKSVWIPPAVPTGSPGRPAPFRRSVSN